METLDGRINITEKLNAKSYVGSGILGNVPFEVFSTEVTELKTRLSKSFEDIKNTQSQSVFTEGSESRKQSDADNILFVIKDSVDTSKIEVLSSETFVIHGPTNSDAFIKRLPYLFYNLAERTRQERLGLVSAHAAAVAKDEKGILILGDKGSGKTSLLLALCLTRGYEMIGNDSVLLGGKEKLSIVAGSHQISVRLPVAKKLGLPIEDKTVIGNRIDYEIKSTFLPRNLGIKMRDESVPLSTVVRINLHSDNPDFISSDIPFREIEALRLSENFSRYIRGIPTPLELSDSGIHGYFPSLDTERLTEFRSNIINLLMKSPFLYVAGKDPIVTAQKFDEIVNTI